MSTELDLAGVERVMRSLDRLADRFPNEVERALYEELQIEAVESRKRTPVDTGALRGSHHVETEQTGRDIKGTITVGGPAAPYAIIVHEDLTAFHKVGQAKFLESTLMESKRFMAQRIARRIELERLV